MTIEGKNAILESIESGIKIKKIYKLTNLKNDSMNKTILDLKKDGTKIIELDRNELDRISQTKNHKGIIAEVDDYKYSTLDDIIQFAKSKNENFFILILDEIEDPRNLGAIIRSAYAFGVHGIIIKDKNSADITATVINTSAGATSHIKIVKVINISKTIEYLKKENIWFYEADMDGESIYDTKFDGGICVVLGNEGRGVSRLVSEHCDFKIKIPMKTKINSLNVSVASGIILSEINRQRKV